MPPSPRAGTRAPTTVAPKQLKAWLDEGRKVTILDVRDPEEHQAWSIPGSLNVPLSELTRGASVVMPPDGTLVTVCMRGRRSEKARALLEQRGIPAKSLEGGMLAWNGVYDISTLTTSAGATILQFRRLGKGCLSYLIVSAGEAAVIDPTLDVDEYIQAADAEGARILHVLDTHAHADHVSGARILATATAARYHASDDVSRALPHELLDQGTSVPLGRTSLRAIHTPGHTPFSMTLAVDEALFTGDSLFLDGVGRPDLGQDPRPNAAVLWHTLHERLFTLGAASLVLPAHHASLARIAPGQPLVARLSELREALAPLRLDEHDFVAWAASAHAPRPANHERIKRINQGHEPMGEPDEMREAEAGPNRCALG